MKPVVAMKEPCFLAVFVFGDSLSDTGNGVLKGNILSTRASQIPYGKTFPGRPTGRFSDGRLLVDFLAKYVGLPLLNPSLDSSADFSRGVNYAVSGATALNASYLNSRFIFTLGRDDSLEVQLGWHLAFKGSKATAKKPNVNAFANGLYVLEIGGNDYLNALRLYSPSQVSSEFVPLIVDKIRQTSEVLYANGARHFLFISVPPLGCSPFQLVRFPNDAKDSFGCLQDLNALSYKHSSELLKLVHDLRGAHPDATFVFVDYYGAYIHVLQNSGSYGFTNTLDACCGAGKLFPHNFNLLLFCNKLTSTTIPASLCHDPNVYLSWDGIHLTDRLNSHVFNLTIGTGSYLNPSQGFSMCTP